MPLGYEKYVFREFSMENKKDMQEYEAVKVDPKVVIEKEIFVEPKDIYDKGAESYTHYPAKMLVGYYVKASY